MPRQLSPQEYTVGWICALHIEMAAALEMFDEEHADLKLKPDNNDQNVYALGTICGHNTAIVCLPAGWIGNNPAAVVATQMQDTFKGIRFGLLVGIGGGVPSVDDDIRLGDVVVSLPRRTFGGVVQFDSGKTTPSGFTRTGTLNTPPNLLLSAISKVRADECREKSKLLDYVAKVKLPEFQRSKAGPDVLYQADYDHESGRGQKCNACREDRQEKRSSRNSGKEVVVHYGTIASGNQVMKDARQRDSVSSELEGVLCFEMEAAGLMNNFPCLVIRGVCDYADSHKNKQWQRYASVTAAAYAKELLSTIATAEVVHSVTLEEVTQKIVGLPKKTERPSENRAIMLPFIPPTNGVDQYERSRLQFGCETCGRKFPHKEAANQHVEEKNHWPRHKCRTCKKEFASDRAADEHKQKLKHWPPNIICQQCNKTFKDLDAAYQHRDALGHECLEIFCKMCQSKFRKKTAAERHEKEKGHLVLSGSLSRQ